MNPSSLIPQAFSQRWRSSHVFRQIGVRSGHGVRAVAYIPTIGRQASRRFQRPVLPLSGPISVHGVCATDVPRIAARHRGLSSGTANQTVSPGHTWTGQQKRTLRRQFTPRLAHLSRVRSTLDHGCPITVCQRSICHRFVANRLCTGFLVNQTVPDAVSMGHLPPHHRSHQTAHFARSAWRYTDLYPHQ